MLGELLVGRLQLALEGQLALELLHRAAGLDLLHRHVGHASEHGVEGPREAPELVLGCHLGANEEVAQLRASHGGGDALDGLEQEPSRGERDRERGEGQREERSEDRALLELPEGGSGIDLRDPFGVGDQRA